MILGAVITNSGAVAQNNADVSWEATMDGGSVASGTETEHLKLQEKLIQLYQHRIYPNGYG